MSCDILDFRCIFVNELIGDAILAVLVLGIFFFAYTSYKRIGLKTTLWLACAYFPIVSYFVTGGSYVIAIVTFVVSLLVAFLHTRIVGNR